MTESKLKEFLDGLSPLKNQNVTSSLQRIKKLRNFLAEHGRSLGFTALKGQTVSLETTDSSLEDVVKEYNKIVLKTVPTPQSNTGTDVSDSIKVDSSQTVTVSPGYYNTEFKITGAVSSEVTAELEKLKADIKAACPDPKDVVNGASTFTIVENQNKTLTINRVTGTAGSAETPLKTPAKSADSKLTLQNESGNTLNTTVGFYNGGEVEAKITISTGNVEETEGTKIIVTKELPAGYYDKGIKIKPVLNEGDNTNKVVNVEADKSVVISHSGNTTLTPSEGFDFIKNGTIKVAEGSASVAATINGNSITLVPSHKDGWLSTNPEVTGAQVTGNENGTYTITIPTISTDGNAKAVVNSKNKIDVIPGEGYYDGISSVPLKFEKDGESKEIQYRADTEITNDPVLDDASSKYNISIIDGRTPSLFTGPLGVKLDASSLSINGTKPEGFTTTRIINVDTNKQYISTSKGYTEGETAMLSIKNAGALELTSEHDSVSGTDKIVVKPTSAGWIDTTSTDVTSKFLGLTDRLVDSSQNGDADHDGIIDSTKGTSNEVTATTGQVLLPYNNCLDRVAKGTIEKTPVKGTLFYKSVKVDLSSLIVELDNI